MNMRMSVGKQTIIHHPRSYTHCVAPFTNGITIHRPLGAWTVEHRFDTAAHVRDRIPHHRPLYDQTADVSELCLDDPVIGLLRGRGDESSCLA